MCPPMTSNLWVCFVCEFPDILCRFQVKTLSEVLARSCHFLATPSLETQALALGCMRDCVLKLASAGADAGETCTPGSRHAPLVVFLLTFGQPCCRFVVYRRCLILLFGRVLLAPAFDGRVASSVNVINSFLGGTWRARGFGYARCGTPVGPPLVSRVDTIEWHRSLFCAHRCFVTKPGYYFRYRHRVFAVGNVARSSGCC